MRILTGSPIRLAAAAAFVALALMAGPGVGPAAAQDPGRTRIVIEIPADTSAGRLLLFAQPVQPGETAPPTAVSADPFFHKDNFVAGRELPSKTAGDRIAIDADDLSYPASLEALASGDYWVQAVLDRDHDYAYLGRPDAGDLMSEVSRVALPHDSKAPVLVLGQAVPAYSLWETARGPKFSAEDQAIVERRIRPFAFTSPALSRFHGRPVAMQGMVVTPEGYDEGRDRYPTVYLTHGFAAGMDQLADTAVGLLTAMHAGRLPPMIWVLLDQSGPFGTHEFADSVNNGPWATALTTELIPDLESRHRMDATTAGRFLMGHSSGGWAMLWLQLNHPDLFGGAWVSAPDYTDFTDYDGVDLTRTGAVVISEMARMEAVLGDYGGQATAFEAVFSPRGPDGRPLPLFDRVTGVVDASVAQHWREHWDVTELVRRRWAASPQDYDDRLHVWVGDEDQFGLDRSVRRLEASVRAAGGRADFTYMPGKGHFDLYADGGDRQALRRLMAWQIYQRARPGSGLADPGPPPVRAGR